MDFTSGDGGLQDPVRQPRGGSTWTILHYQARRRLSRKRYFPDQDFRQYTRKRAHCSSDLYQETPTYRRVQIRFENLRARYECKTS